MKNGSHWKGTAAVATEVWMHLIGIDGAEISNMKTRLTLRNHADAHTLGGSGTASLGLLVDNNRFDQRGGTTQDEVVDMFSGTTGLYTNNQAFGDTGTLVGTIKIADMAAAQSFVTTTVSKHGIIDPAVA